MSKRLAITISGAVSLGSYEGGVLYEILTALAQHNLDPRTTPDKKICVDVLTGASAGGMTATICAQKLLYENESFVDHRNNPLYLPWVKDVSLAGLLNLSKMDDPTESILSSELIQTISRRYLMQRYTTGLPPVISAHPACATSLFLGLAISNLNGIDYAVPMMTGGQFIYTRHQDQFIRQLTGAACDQPQIWDPIRQAAVACGSFPFAFRVQELIRLQSEYTQFTNSAPVGYPASSGAYAYTDGGVFQNEPLGMAKNLVDLIDHHQNFESRLYLFVAPGAKSSTINSDFRAANAKFFPLAERLVSAIFEQGRFQDWIMAESVNQQIALFNQRAMALHGLLLNGSLNLQSVVTVNNGLLASFYADAASAQADFNRLQQQFASEYSDLAKNVSQAAANAWITAILLFERAANLPDKDEMQIFGITATSDQLAGDVLMSFGGFFDQRLRDNDYDLGRLKTRQFIDAVNNNPNSPFYPIHYMPSPNQPITAVDPALGTSTVQDLPQAQRVQLRNQIKNRVWETLSEIGFNDVVKFGIQEFFIDKKLNQWLALS